MVSVPSGAFVDVHDAVPDVSPAVVHREVEPVLMATVPVGVPPGLMTWAVKVTACPDVTEATDTATVVVVTALATARGSETVAVPPAASVTLKVGVKVPAPDGVPFSVPVEVFKNTPAGKVPLCNDH
jgi:hypothetical protein